MGLLIAIGTGMRRLAALSAAAVSVMAIVATSTASASGSGAMWSLQAAPSPSGPPNATLTGVSCPSATFCMAVGSSDFGLDRLGDLVAPIATFAERWDGSAWTVLPTPPAGVSPGLYAVSCAAPTFCVAVGSTHTPGRQSIGLVGGASGSRAVMEMWDGASWVVRPTPLGSVRGSVLSDVSCASTRFCLAVGASGESSSGIAWNGSTWRRIALPAVKYGTSITAIDCPAVNACTAVGSYNVDKTGVAELRPLAAQWSGGHWAVAKPPPERDRYRGKPLSNFTWLTSVSCVSRRSCLATGLALRTQNIFPNGGFADRWDGHRWTVATAGIARDSPLYHVSCVAADDCYAAGQYDPHTITSPATQQPLVERWTSGRWSRSALPAVGTLTNRVWFEGNLLDPNLYAISCLLHTGCVAVGAQPHGTDSAPLALSDL